MKKKPKPAKPKSFAPAPPRIVTTWHLGHWSAWFEDFSQIAYGGDTPVVAVERLFTQSE